MTKQQLIEVFNNHKAVHISFEKKDGSLRHMYCTTNLKLIPAHLHPKGAGRPPSETVFNVFDLTEGGWRSFKIENLLSIEGE